MDILNVNQVCARLLYNSKLYSMVNKNSFPLVNRRVFRYLAAGSMTALSEYLSFILLVSIHVNILGANALSYTISLLVGFTLNRTWVFKSTGSHYKQAAHYAVLSIINLGIGTALIWVLTDVLSVMPYLAKITSMAIIASSNYIIFSKLLFKDQS